MQITETFQCKTKRICLSIRNVLSTFSSVTDPHKYKEALHQIDKKNCIKFKCSIVQVSPEGISVEEPFDVCFLN